VKQVCGQRSGKKRKVSNIHTSERPVNPWERLKLYKPFLPATSQLLQKRTFTLNETAGQQITQEIRYEKNWIFKLFYDVYTAQECGKCVLADI
jgi:hypothetical protein